jgi:hypothetical protein
LRRSKEFDWIDDGSAWTWVAGLVLRLAAAVVERWLLGIPGLETESSDGEAEELRRQQSWKLGGVQSKLDL